MRCVWIEDGRLSTQLDHKVPSPMAGEALISVHLAGLCATDLEVMRGYTSFVGIPGHEFVGHVVSSPDSPEWVGKRVVGEINVPCRRCTDCLSGLERHCLERTVIGIVGRDGVLSDYLTLPVGNLHEVPEGMPDEVALFSEPLAAALEITDQVHIKPASRVLVVGAGRLGQLIARVLTLSGCEMLVVARQEKHLRALEKAKIAACEPAEVDGLEPFDVVVEASGASEGFVLARRALRTRGTLVLKSTYAGRLELDASTLVVDEITLVGSRCGPFGPALRLLERGLVDPRPLVVAKYPIEDAELAFDHAAKPGALKVVIAIKGES